VERLRALARDYHQHRPHYEEAAARIEALEAALRMLIDNVESGSYESTGQAIDSARAALATGEKKDAENG
jgi:DnaJ-class molecular chaperone